MHSRRPGARRPCRLPPTHTHHPARRPPPTTLHPCPPCSLHVPDAGGLLRPGVPERPVRPGARRDGRGPAARLLDCGVLLALAQVQDSGQQQLHLPDDGGVGVQQRAGVLRVQLPRWRLRGRGGAGARAARHWPLLGARPHVAGAHLQADQQPGGVPQRWAARARGYVGGAACAHAAALGRPRPAAPAAAPGAAGRARPWQGLCRRGSRRPSTSGSATSPGAGYDAYDSEDECCYSQFPGKGCLRLPSLCVVADQDRRICHASNNFTKCK
jgi:hypothetical protein